MALDDLIAEVERNPEFKRVMDEQRAWFAAHRDEIIAGIRATDITDLVLAKEA